jgi:hypothetical protein
MPATTFAEHVRAIERTIDELVATGEARVEALEGRLAEVERENARLREGLPV